MIQHNPTTTHNHHQNIYMSNHMSNPSSWQQFPQMSSLPVPHGYRMPPSIVVSTRQHEVIPSDQQQHPMRMSRYPYQSYQQQSQCGTVRKSSSCPQQQQVVVSDGQHPVSPSAVFTIEPPCWAVPAKGDSRLEPIGETIHTHPAIDLTTRPSFLIGRSPSSDMFLLHPTSSRRHALLFHHPNGSCYITDCHSAHGTFVNGIRVQPYPHPPRKIRRGAMVRFGGPGAPCFVLKSFAVGFGEMVRDLGGVADSCCSEQPEVPKRNWICESSSTEDEEAVPATQPWQRRVPPNLFRHAKQWVRHSRKRMLPDRTSSGEAKDADVLACIRNDGGGIACIADERDAPTAALVLLNTRLNALGPGGLHCTQRRRVAEYARERFSSLASRWNAAEDTCHSQNPMRSRKRCRDEETMSEQWNCRLTKRIKPILRSSSAVQSRIQPMVHCIQDTNVSFLNTPTFQPTPIPSKLRQRRIRFADEVEPLSSPHSVTGNDKLSSSDDEQPQQQQRRCWNYSLYCPKLSHAATTMTTMRRKPYAENESNILIASSA